MHLFLSASTPHSPNPVKRAEKWSAGKKKDEYSFTETFSDAKSADDVDDDDASEAV